MGRYFRATPHITDMTDYTVTGRWETPSGWQTFETNLDAVNESVAVEHVYAEFGSRHNLRRTQIEIEEVAE
jgi:large subunit ribosomal protein LX